MNAEQASRWKLAIRRLEALANSDPIQDLPDVQAHIQQAVDDMRAEFGQRLVGVVMMGAQVDVPVEDTLRNFGSIEPCSSCGATIDQCDESIRTKKVACCGRCGYTDTHGVNAGVLHDR